MNNEMSNKMRRLFGWTYRNHQQVDNLLSATQHLVLVIGLVVTGYWTFTTYREAKSVEFKNAEIAFEKRRLSLIPSVSIRIDSKVLSRDPDGAAHVKIIVNLTNEGSGPVNLRFLENPDDPGELVPLKVQLQNFFGDDVEAVGSSDPIFVHARDLHKAADGNWDSAYGSKLVAKGEKDQLNFLVRLTEPGIYLVSFNAQFPKDNFDDLQKFGLLKGTKTLRFGHHDYIFIPPLSNP